jgi:hypothetical protein
MLLYVRRVNPSGRRVGSNDRSIASLDFPLLPWTTTTTTTTTKIMRIAQLFIFVDLTLVTCAHMADHRIRDWLSDQIKQQKLSPLRLSGRHNSYDTHTLTTQEVLDFDFTAQCSEFVDLEMIEIKRSNVVNEITIVTGETHDEAGEEELMQQATKNLQDIANSGDRFVILSVQGTSHESDGYQYHVR